MQFEKKAHRSLLLLRILLTLILVVSLSTLGFFATRNVFDVQNVSAVTTPPNIGVYWDQGGARPVTSIDWGNVSVGSENRRVVFAKNLGQDPLVLSMNTSTWNPLTAALKIYLCWDYDGNSIAPNNVVMMTLKLFVSSTVTGIRNFSFSINIGAGFEKSVDVNGDGVVNIKDASILALAWLARAGSSDYNSRCDFNNDGVVNVSDVSLLALAFK